VPYDGKMPGADVDGAGHHDGPLSTAVRRAVRRVDGYLGRLLSGLEERGIAGRVNRVVVSDHGMAEASLDRVVVLDDLVPLDAVDVVDIRRWPRSWACPPRTTTATPRSRGRCRAEAAPPCDDLPQPAADRHARSLRHVVAAGRRTMDSRNKPGY